MSYFAERVRPVPTTLLAPVRIHAERRSSYVSLADLGTPQCDEMAPSVAAVKRWALKVGARAPTPPSPSVRARVARIFARA